MIEAVIFDMDGTIVDTISVYLAAYLKVLHDELGLPIAEKDVEEKFGKKASAIVMELLEDVGMNPTEEEIAELIDRIRDEFKSHFKKVLVLPGAYKLLKELKKGGYKIALATSSRHYAVDLILDKFDLLGYFDAVITGDEVIKSKPDPESFLKAAEALGVDPKDCLVVEDAAYGVQAAKAAGMKTVGVCTGGCASSELRGSNADIVLDTLEEFDLSILN